MIHQEVKSKQSFGIHWGTFQSSHEYYLEPFTLTKEEAEKAGLKDGEFAIIQLGNTIQAKVGGGTKKKSKKKKAKNDAKTVTTEEL